MPDAAQIREEALRLRDRFAAEGADLFETAILQPADTLLDLYGEDIRGRAYVTTDPLRGEQMLRPDFTVPVVQAHMASGRAPARYTYAGEVFRQQEQDPERPNEYFQTGLELFNASSPAEADADVFAAICSALEGLPLRAVTGDIGVLAAAIDGLEASAVRKAALRRHMWRPARFRALLDRFAGRTPVPAARVALLEAVAAGADPISDAGPEIGLRSRDEVLERLQRLAEEAAEAAIPATQVALLDQILDLKGPAVEMPARLRGLTGGMPTLAQATDRIAARLDAMAERGVDVDTLEFEASFGRTSLEYYDGFVFGLLAEGHPDWPAVASGGRYDALTRVLGGGRVSPAVGGVIRPELVLLLNEAATC